MTKLMNSIEHRRIKERRGMIDHPALKQDLLKVYEILYRTGVYTMTALNRAVAKLEARYG